MKFGGGGGGGIRMSVEMSERKSRVRRSVVLSCCCSWVGIHGLSHID